MLIANITRENLLCALPQSDVVAEVGVYRGAFSRAIKACTNPGQMHLIDPWGKVSTDEYVNRYDVKDDMELLYNNVKDMFAKDIEGGTVFVHREYSTDVFGSFPDEFFDWVYVDALHTYQGAYDDLANFQNKVKSCGFLLGHDFSNFQHGRDQQFGVIAAVLDFCEHHEWHILLVTLEDAPSYVLSRDPRSEFSRALVDRALSKPGAAAFEVDPWMWQHFEQIEKRHSGGSRRLMFRFGEIDQQRSHFQFKKKR